MSTRCRAAAASLLLVGSSARAQGPLEPPSALPLPALAEDEPDVLQASPQGLEPASPFTLGGYAEAFWAWSFNRPDNGLTAYRGFDNRHDSFTLSNVVLDAQWDAYDVVGHVALQVGHTPSTYYGSEPTQRGAPGANTSNSELWKYLQQANVGVRVPLGTGLLVQAGLFLSPIGPESMAVRDNWHWSRSNLFFGLPYYHTGVRGSYELGDAWTVTLAAYNGWNSVVDNNRQKSLSTQLGFAPSPRLSATLLYFGGVERDPGAPEGSPWRHLFDAYATWRAASWLTFMAQLDGGFERTRFGAARWGAAAGSTRVSLGHDVYLAARGDLFREHVPSDEHGSASPIVWPVAWVSSGTLTAEYRPRDRASLRLEYRHDEADEALYFRGRVAGEGTPTRPFVPDARRQDTLLAGLTAWF